PRFFGGLGDPDPHASRDLRRAAAPAQFERCAVERQAVLFSRDAQRFAQFTGPRTESPLVAQAAPAPHRRETLRRGERADQHRAGTAVLLADEIEAPVDA